MIARFQILLPSVLSVPADRELTPYDVEIDGFSARVYPPHRSQVDRSLFEPDSEAPLAIASSQLDPADPQPRTANIQIGGSDAIQADTLRIDFFREGDFDRRPDADDPPIELCFRLTNDLLARIRILGLAPHVKPVARGRSSWRLEYLTDDGDPAESGEGLQRARNSVQWSMSVTGVSPELWAATRDLPDDFSPSPWDTLLLDAMSLFPEIGAPIVLAFAAVETRIENALDVLAPAAGLSDDLWAWIKKREGDYRKEPSIGEQMDTVLRLLCGEGLKDDPRLWQAFQNLRNARNTFVHQGEAIVGSDLVTPEKATELVVLAVEIIDWIESRLPEESRRPTYAGAADASIEIQRAILPPQVEEGGEPPPPAPAS